MSKKVQLPLKLVKQLVDPIFVKAVRDKQFVSDALMNMLGETNLEFFLDLVSREAYTPVTQYCHVKFKPPLYRFDEYQIDILKDMGLYKDGYMYGQVMDDDSYSSSNFDSYYYKMKVNVFLHSLHSEKEFTVTSKEESIETKSLIVINKDDIPYWQISEVFQDGEKEL